MEQNRYGEILAAVAHVLCRRAAVGRCHGRGRVVDRQTAIPEGKEQRGNVRVRSPEARRSAQASTHRAAATWCSRITFGAGRTLKRGILANRHFLRATRDRIAGPSSKALSRWRARNAFVQAAVRRAVLVASVRGADVVVVA